ncbi:hypothetical protein PTKIN_Ptkin08bG0012600 [Pterospermum kingtungense]
MFETTTKNLGHDLFRHHERANDHSPKPIFGNPCRDGPPLFTKTQLIREFRLFDSNRDGRLSRQELKNAFNSLGSRLPIYRAVVGLYVADENGDGYITEDEMAKLVQYALSCGYHVD